jgi:hypothetical protein
VRVYVIQDSEGKIVGTVPAGVQETDQVPKSDEPSAEAGTKIQIRPIPLPGQTVHEVELPRELESLSGFELHNELIGYEVTAGEAKLTKGGS